MSRRRKVDKKFKRRKRGIIFFIFLLIFFMLSFKTSLFDISSVQVIGNKNLSKDEVIRVLGDPVSENIFRINIKKMEANLQAHPYIKEAKIKRKVPNKLNIEIKEREEKFIVPYTESYVYVDEEGSILRIEPKISDEKIPLMLGINIEKPEIGNKISPKENININMEDIEEIATSIDELNLLIQVESINFSDKKNIDIGLINGIKVAFGPLNNVKYKLSYLYKILDDISKKNLNCKYIYFNKGENPIIVTDNK